MNEVCCIEKSVSIRCWCIGTELQYPQGISTIVPPPLLLSTEMYSSNCELLISSRKTDGIKIENYYNKAVVYAGIASVIAVIQIFSLIYQMEYTPTPSVRAVHVCVSLACTDLLARAYQMCPIGLLLCRLSWMGICACCTSQQVLSSKTYLYHLLLLHFSPLSWSQCLACDICW